MGYTIDSTYYTYPADTNIYDVFSYGNTSNAVSPLISEEAALSAITMTPLQTGVEASYTFSFTLKNNLANDGYIVINLPTGISLT